MRVDMGDIPFLMKMVRSVGVIIVGIKSFSDPVTKTDDFLFCFDSGEVLFVRSSAELESVVVMCNSIKELAKKVINVEHVRSWYERWEKNNYQDPDPS
jgi:hypothetical protein